MAKFVMPTEAEVEAEFKRAEAAGEKPLGKYDAKHNLINKRMRDCVRSARKLAKEGKPADAVVSLCDFMLTTMEAMQKDH